MTTAMTGWRRLRTPVADTHGDPEAAAQARAAAEAVLRQEQEKQVHTSQLAERMRELRERNHFADLIAGQIRKKKL